MTVAATPRTAGPFAGNDATTAFPFTFKVFTSADVGVYVTDTSGVQTLLGTGYTVALNADQTASPGGTVTYPAAGSPLATGASLSIAGASAYQQATALANASAFPPVTVEGALDYLTILTQQLLDASGRAITLPPGDSLSPVLPTTATRKGKYFGFDAATGAPTVLAGSGTTTDAALVNFTAAVTGPAARTSSSKQRDIVSLKDYSGMVIDDVTDNTVPMGRAVADLNSGAVRALWHPGGRCRLAGTFTITADGFAVYGVGSRISVFSQNLANTDLFVVSNTTPNTTPINDVTMRDIGIDYGNLNSPTAGLALKLVRVTRSKFHNVDIRSVFQGVLVSGGYDNVFSDIVITGAYSWASAKAGSYLMKFGFYNSGGTTEVPSEIFLNNFNIKGSDPGGYLERAIWIEAGDGLFLSNGHCGFASDSAVAIVPIANAAASILEVMFSNVYMDGNNFGSTAGGAVNIAGSITPTVGGISFTACTMKIHKGSGVLSNLSSLTDLKIIACTIKDNGNEAIKIVGGTGFVITGNDCKGNNTNNASKNCIDISGAATDGVISTNRIGAGAPVHPVGVAFSGSSNDWAVASNSMSGSNTLAFTVSATNRIAFKGNRRTGAVPTVVAASPLVLPLGYDVVQVTGNTGFSSISATDIESNMVTLQFTGTPTLTDGVGNLKLAGNFVATAGSTITLVDDGSNWNEVARAIV